MTRAERRGLTPQEKLALIRREQDVLDQLARGHQIKLHRSVMRTFQLARTAGDLKLAEYLNRWIVSATPERVH